jgi:hypothetical protein
MSAMEHVKRRVEQLAPGPFDASVFNDEVALRTSWQPLVQGGANFRTKRLVRVGERRLEIRKSFGAYLFGGVFFLAGCLPLFFGGQELMLGEITGLVMLVFGVIFCAVGTFLAWPTSLRIDGDSHCVQLKDNEVAFGAISALQIIEEIVDGSDSRYSSFELNLVLCDGSRHNLIDHGDVTAVRADAARIRECIGCALWDASNTRRAID